MTTKNDALIIGAGIMGCSIAFELSKSGWKTLNVDTLPAAGHGSTANTCAIIRVTYSTLDGSALAYESFHDWDDWAGYLGMVDPAGMARFNKTGIMMLKTEGNDGAAHMIEHLEELGVPFEEWGMEQVRERFPFLDDQSFYPPRLTDDPEFGTPTGRRLLGALYYPCGGYISDPVLSTRNVESAAKTHGARFRYNARVVAVNRANGRATGVTLEDGETIEAPVVVNAAGPHSFVVNRMAGVEQGMKIRTRALRQEVVHLPAPPGVDVGTVGVVTSDSDIGCYSRPETGNHILCGSEDPPCDVREWIDDPDDFNRNLTHQATTQAMRLGLRIPSLGIPSRLQGLVDLYDVTDDWIPIYDRSDLDGFYLCIGTSGNQYKNGPVVGRLMTKLIEEVEAGRDHDADPVQLHLERVGRTVSLGFYSRLREINRESSFSVLG